jgi:hypothetical protein
VRARRPEQGPDIASFVHDDNIAVVEVVGFAHRMNDWNAAPKNSIVESG